MTEAFDPLALSEHQRRTLAEAPVMAGMAIYAVGHPSPWGAVRELRAASAANHLIRHPGERGAATELVAMLAQEARSGSVSRDLRDRLDVDDARLSDVAHGALHEAAAVAAEALPPEVYDEYVGWVLEVAKDVANTSPDWGERVAVSSAEYEMLSRIAGSLRGGQ